MSEQQKMQWVERRFVSFLVSPAGKFLGRVLDNYHLNGAYRAEAIYAVGNDYKQGFGDYITADDARAAVEAHVKAVGLVVGAS